MKKYLIIVSFLVAVILISPNVSLAQTSSQSVADLQAKIAALMAQIQALQTQISQQQPQQWCYDFKYNLNAQSSGKEVGQLQTALEKEGFIIDELEKTNQIFDESTADAVIGFQQKYKDEILTPNRLKYGTGFVGKSTRAKLNKLYGCGAIRLVPTPLPAPTPILIPAPNSTPSINVLSPNGGEQIPTGPNNFKITYKVNNFEKLSSPAIRIELLQNGVLLGNRCDGCSVYSSPDYWNFSWEVGSYYDSAGAYRKAGVGTGYKIRIILFDNKIEVSRDESDAPFSIAATAATSCVDTDGADSGNVKGYMTWAPYTTGAQKTDVDYCTNNPSSPALDIRGEGKYVIENYCIDSNYPGAFKVVECPYGCKDGACLAATANSAQPFITVLSPNSGEKWETGKTYAIKWSSKNIPSNSNVDIELLKLTKVSNIYERYGAAYIGTTINDGVEQWTVPNNIQSGDQYIINISGCNTDIKVPESESGYLCTNTIETAPFFSIAATTSQIPLTVDFKVNGLDNPTVSYDSIITASWTSTGAISCGSNGGHYVPLVDGGLWTDSFSLPLSGAKQLYARHANFGYISPLEIEISCYGQVSPPPPGASTTVPQVQDRVFINVLPPVATTTSAIPSIIQMASILESAKSILIQLSESLKSLR